MKEILINAGFTLLSKCSCSGTYTEKWIKNSDRFDIRPNRKKNQWTFRKSGQVIKSGNADELQEYIQKIG